MQSQLARSLRTKGKLILQLRIIGLRLKDSENTKESSIWSLERRRGQGKRPNPLSLIRSAQLGNPAALNQTSETAKSKQKEMANDARRAAATKGSKKKSTTMDRFSTKKGAQGSEETGEEGRQGTSPKAAPPSQGENCPQAFLELQSKVIRMEEICQEKWEAAQKENNSLRARILQLETEA